jgi:hypothetical protein
VEEAFEMGEGDVSERELQKETFLERAKCERP